MDKNGEKYCKLVGETIREMREKTKKSVRLFAYENDIPQSTLSRIERGESEAQLVTLKKISEAFNISLSELFKKIELKLPKNFKIFDEDYY